MSNNKIGWCFNNTYSKLPDKFSTKINPVPVKAPQLVILNENLSKELNLNFSENSKEELSEIFSGNKLPEGSSSLAQAYAGHQFGHFTILGDGRATLMGEHTLDNKRFDIQFKGSGQTPFSRNGDGRAALGPMLREYIISEAMNALGIPTTRSLAVVKTGEEVIREERLQGAILTRVASSHIRVGTFQYFTATQDEKNLKTLFDYTIKRHYPNIKKSKNQGTDLLEVLMEKQINLVLNWMRVGFIHGVMNTDNMAVSGETIDYGPCAFMDAYDPKTVFSSIDHMGRYSYSNQPIITKWNLARFAECLLTFIHSDKDEAIKTATEIINNFEILYEKKWLNMMRDKLGLFGEDKEDEVLILNLLDWMFRNKADYTNTFIFLMGEKIPNEKIYEDSEFLNWKNKWHDRLKLNKNSKEKYLKLMRSVNPLVIPRNHHVEKALEHANKDDLQPMIKLLNVLNQPYVYQKNTVDYQDLPPVSDEKYVTFCGT